MSHCFFFVSLYFVNRRGDVNLSATTSRQIPCRVISPLDKHSTHTNLYDKLDTTKTANMKAMCHQLHLDVLISMSNYTIPPHSLCHKYITH